MSSLENGDLELDGTFPDRYVSIPGKVLIMAMEQLTSFSASYISCHLLLMFLAGQMDCPIYLWSHAL